MAADGRPTDDHRAPGGPVDAEGPLFGPYRLLDLLGRGGMGEVWRAYDTRRERTVALKRLAAGWADDPSFRERFRLEARATARLNSEHVVVIHDFGEIDGRLFIDMRLVSGGDLAGALTRSPGGLGVDRAVDLCAQIADALDDAHREHLVHRDVKPSNVLLAPDAHGQRAYLVDFGIAKLADETTGAGLTTTGSTLGTPAYMAPELYTTGGASTASDVYALGCVLFEMLTGRRVFGGTTAAALMSAHLHEPPPAPSSLRGELTGFDPVLARALDKDPARRHPSPGALAAEATAVYTGDGPTRRVAIPAATLRRPHGAPGDDATLVTRPPTPSHPWRRGWWSRRRLVVAAVVTALVVLGGGLAAGVAAHRSDRPPAVTANAPAPAAPVRSVPGPPQELPVTVSAPGGLVFSPDGRRAYIADQEIVTVVDTGSGRTLATIPTGPSPDQIAISPDGGRVYVVNVGSDDAPGTTVSVVDTVADALVATVPVGSEPLGIVVSPDGRRVYVANSGTRAQPGRTVSVIDTTSNAVVATVPVGTGAGRLGVSPDGARVYVPDYGTQDDAGSTLSVIDTATNASTPLHLPPGDDNLAPAMSLPSPDGRRVYITTAGGSGTSGNVLILDPATGTITPLGVHPVDLPAACALTPDGRTLVVPNRGTDARPDTTVSIIDTGSGTVRRVDVGQRPYGVATTPDGQNAWVTTANAHVFRIPV